MKAVYRIIAPAMMFACTAAWGQTPAQTPAQPPQTPPSGQAPVKPQTPAQTQTPTPNQPDTPGIDPLVGDWTGNLTSDLPIVVHITQGKDSYSATTDSPSQGTADIPTTVSFDGATIKISTVAATPSTFIGTFDGDRITGKFTEGGISVPLTLTRSTPDTVATLVGDWQATTGGVQVIVHISNSGRGYSATTDSPNQKITGIRTAIAVNGSGVRLQIASDPAAIFVGIQEGGRIVGTFTQARNSTTLTLSKVAEPSPPDLVSGDWRGAITELVPITVHIRATPRGFTAATDSPTLGKSGARTQITVNGATVALRFAGSPPAVFVGHATSTTLTGTLTLGRNSRAFTLTKAAN